MTGATAGLTGDGKAVSSSETSAEVLRTPLPTCQGPSWTLSETGRARARAFICHVRSSLSRCSRLRTTQATIEKR